MQANIDDAGAGEGDSRYAGWEGKFRFIYLYLHLNNYQHDFDWTPPSKSEDALHGLKVHIQHLRRKKEAMCQCFEEDEPREDILEKGGYDQGRMEQDESDS